jgi:ABC-2 type transport system permease protein
MYSFLIGSTISSLANSSAFSVGSTRTFRRSDSAVRRVGHATGSPVRREALVAGRILKEAVVVVIQSLIIVALALIVGASFPGGVGGVAVLFAGSALLGAMFGALSNGFALIMRQEEALIGATQFILLPLTFLSTTFLAANLIPKWMGHVANFNPVNWAVVAGRLAVSSNADWGLIAARAGLRVALLALSVAFATRAFQSYQRSV